ncbi:MAG: type IV pilus biogenesis/stability protein PilW [Rhodanobacter sp.]
MRFDLAIVLVLASSLTGCVTTHTSSNALARNLPQTTNAEKAVDAARVHTELAQHYMAQGDLQTALEKLQQALTFDPNFAPAHTVMGLLYERINQPAKAEEHYRRAVELEPDKGAPNNNFGQFLCSVGKFKEAEGYFEKAIADPFYKTPDVALSNSGVCHLQANNVAAAEADFRRALERNPDNAEALFQLARLLYAGNNAFGASAFLQRLDALNQPTAAMLKLGYDIESRLGHHEGAAAYAKRLHKLFPDAEQARAVNNNAASQ